MTKFKISRMAKATKYSLLICLLALTNACSEKTPSENESSSAAEQSVPSVSATDAVVANETQTGLQCNETHPQKKAYFGDLHVHTTYSFDAYANGTQVFPDDAYKFAKGEPISIPAVDGIERTSQLNKPLDFTSVTDHSEFMGEWRTCMVKDNPLYDSKSCEIYRGAGWEGFLHFGSRLSDPEGVRDPALCGEDGTQCGERASLLWQDIIAVTESHNDTSADCKFVTFPGYEYTGTPYTSNLHRNVIFANENVPSVPVSYLDERTPEGLWTRLDDKCLSGKEGCDVVVIPHNSNLSNGRMFMPVAKHNGDPQKLAELRSRVEVLMEITQHKGASECANGLQGMIGAYDEFCEIEQVRKLGDMVDVAKASQADNLPEDSVIKKSLPENPNIETTDCAVDADNNEYGMLGAGCVSSRDYLRGALALGMQEQKKYGVNPLKLGVIASTDTHLGIPGEARESEWPGHVGYEVPPTARVTARALMPTNMLGNPGGLAGVWAQERSRKAIFSGLKNRETFGTSGVHYRPRMFAGADIPLDICGQENAVEIAYEKGVPIGADLAKSDRAPNFMLSVQGDEDEPAIEHLQLIKGWLDSDGNAHSQVLEAKTVENGAHTMCAVITDKDYNAEQQAYYYARSVSVDVARWHVAVCESLPAEKRTKGCDAPPLGNKTRELAWTSPIWTAN